MQYNKNKPRLVIDFQQKGNNMLSHLLFITISILPVAAHTKRAPLPEEDQSIQYLLQAQEANKLVATQEKYIPYDSLAEERKYNHCISAVYNSAQAAQLNHPFAVEELNKTAEKLKSHAERKKFLKACKKSNLLKHTITKQAAIDYVRGLSIIEEGLQDLRSKYKEPAGFHLEKQIIRGFNKAAKISSPGIEEANNLILYKKLKRLEQISETRELVFSNKFIGKINTIFNKVNV